MYNKDTEKAKIESEEAEKEIARLQIKYNALHILKRICRYSKCQKPFESLDNRQQYCCKEHYLDANRERTRIRNEKAKTNGHDVNTGV